MSKVLLLAALAAGAALTALAAPPAPILLQSRESRTREGTPVFNRIRWSWGINQDVWLMQQSHEGLAPGFGKWDRLAIVVDKTTTPKTARFYQFTPGELRWESGARPLPLRASCFMCHSNGPRAIRPESRPAPDLPLPSLGERVRLALWNLRIRTYGRVELDANQVRAMAGARTPLRYPDEMENERLPLKTCAACHNEAFWGRGSLTRQNFAAIGFLVENGIMPPPGFAMKPGESQALRRFIWGLASRDKDR